MACILRVSIVSNVERDHEMLRVDSARHGRLTNVFVLQVIKEYEVTMVIIIMLPSRLVCLNHLHQVAIEHHNLFSPPVMGHAPNWRQVFGHFPCTVLAFFRGARHLVQSPNRGCILNRSQNLRSKARYVVSKCGSQLWIVSEAGIKGRDK